MRYIEITRTAVSFIAAVALAMVTSCTDSPPSTPRELAELRFEERVDKTGACPEVENGVYMRWHIDCVASQRLERAWCECTYGWHMGRQLVVTYTRARCNRWSCWRIP